MIRAVVSDFGGVLTVPLLEGFARYEERSGVAAEAIGAALARATEAAGGRNPLHELETGAMTEADFLAVLEREVGAVLGRDVSLNGFGATYMGGLHENAELFGYYRALHARGLRLAMLTNNVREWEPRWRPMLPELDEIFEVVVDSGFVGMRKPERGIYELTLERLGGVPASECLFVDDMELNCEAARELGMTAVQFHDSEQARREVEAVLA